MKETSTQEYVLFLYVLYSAILPKMNLLSVWVPKAHGLWVNKVQEDSCKFPDMEPRLAVGFLVQMSSVASCEKIASSLRWTIRLTGPPRPSSPLRAGPLFGCLEADWLDICMPAPPLGLNASQGPCLLAFPLCTFLKFTNKKLVAWFSRLHFKKKRLWLKVLKNHSKEKVPLRIETFFWTWEKT